MKRTILKGTSMQEVSDFYVCNPPFYVQHRMTFAPCKSSITEKGKARLILKDEAEP
jgi:23S rRNA A1618 N6-methylase RlmF